MKKYILMIILGLYSTLFSAGTYNWELNSYKLFNKGDLENVKLNQEGILSLSLKLKKKAELDSLFIWDIKEDSKGNVFLATGNDGVIYKIDNQNAVTEFFSVSSIAAFKMLIDDNDNLYVSTLTKGLIYKISPQGKGDVFRVFPEEYIWDMVFYKGNILLATGTPGSLYELNLQSKEFKELVLTTDMHITCMDIYKDDIYFGTTDKGAVYKYTTKGSLEVLYQTAEKEIHSIALDKKTGVIYAGTSDKDYSYVPFKSSSSSSSKDPYKKPSEGEKKMFDDYKEYQKIKIPANAVYRIEENESVEKIIESKDFTFLSLLHVDNTLYIGSGDSGIIYTYKNNLIEKLVRLDEQQILSIHNSKKNGILIGTGNTGNIYELEPSYSENGVYISDILDARGWAFWGNIQWDAVRSEGQKVEILTRSGNSDSVDESWSDWSENYTRASGEQISSPAGRYLQYKINLTTDDPGGSPYIYSIKIPYLIKNRKPGVSSVSFYKKENNNQAKTPSSKTSYKKYDLKTYELKVQWEAEDEDKDKLQYSLYAKIRGSDDWLLVKEKLDTKNYTFDTRILPDGIFEFKVVADDMPSNNWSTRLFDEKVSKPFIVDNTPPSIKVKYKKNDDDTFQVFGEIDDYHSPIISIAYSTDLKDWVSISSTDGILDTVHEDFEFKYKYSNGLIIIKTEDYSGNITTFHVQIEK
jgi:hypothetical protein